MTKFLDIKKISHWRKKQNNKKIVIVIGCFDIIHIGHITLLQEAKKLGDILLVGINDDLSIKKIKGSNRPINSEVDRATILAALECVDAVCIYKEKTARNLIKMVKPDIYVKGGDYNLQTINQKEREILEKLGIKIQFCKFIKGKSTTKILQKYENKTSISQ